MASSLPAPTRARCSLRPQQQAAVKVVPSASSHHAPLTDRLAGGLLAAAAAFSLTLAPPALAAEPFLKATGACEAGGAA